MEIKCHHADAGGEYINTPPATMYTDKQGNLICPVCGEIFESMNKTITTRELSGSVKTELQKGMNHGNG